MLEISRYAGAVRKLVATAGEKHRDIEAALRVLRGARTFRQTHEDVAIGIAADQNPRAWRDVPIRQDRALEHDAIAIH